MSETALWLECEFEIYDITTLWSEVPGLYIFAGRNSEGQWFPLYVGQTESLAARLPNHEKMLEAVQLGATHIHALMVEDSGLRGV